MDLRNFWSWKINRK